MELGSERRRFQRVMVALEVEYCTNLPEAGDFYGQGVIHDLSLSGAYFFSEPPIPLVPGQILTLTISTALPQLDLHGTSHVQARGEVVRLEHPASPANPHGIAVTFLEDPTFVSTSLLEGC